MVNNADTLCSQVALESVPIFRYEYIATGYTNTGQSLLGINAEGNKIVAPVSVYTLVFGRGPSVKFPPWGYEYGTETPTSLMEWCMTKLGASAQEAHGLSFVIARSIKEHGNQVYRGLKPPVPTEGTVQKADEAAFNAVNDTVAQMIKKYGLH